MNKKCSKIGNPYTETVVFFMPEKFGKPFLVLVNHRRFDEKIETLNDDNIDGATVNDCNFNALKNFTFY